MPGLRVSKYDAVLIYNSDRSLAKEYDWVLRIALLRYRASNVCDETFYRRVSTSIKRFCVKQSATQ